LIFLRQKFANLSCKHKILSYEKAACKMLVKLTPSQSPVRAVKHCAVFSGVIPKVETEKDGYFLIVFVSCGQKET